VVLDYTSHASVDVIEYLVLTGDGVVNTEILANLLELARVLSSEIAALAAERRSDDDLTALDVIVARMRSEKNLSKLLWLDFDFNWTLAGAARNLVPRLLMNSVRGLLAKYTHLLETLWVSPGSITQGYEQVLEAVRSGDAERARVLVRSIWEDVRALRRGGRARQPAPAPSYDDLAPRVAGAYLNCRQSNRENRTWRPLARR
jgi:DNA-binding FadR family transcriptional regulator